MKNWFRAIVKNVDRDMILYFVIMGSLGLGIVGSIVNIELLLDIALIILGVFGTFIITYEIIGISREWIKTILEDKKRLDKEDK